MSKDGFLVDVYQGDLGGHPDWQRLVDAGPPWHGALVKASEGIQYVSSWFGTQWRALKTCAGSRYGVDFWRGAYHYWRAAQDPIKQAHVFLGQVQAAGGFDTGDLVMIDVEGANNGTVTGQQIVASVSAWVEEVKRETGKKVVLYGNMLLAESNVTDHCGCDALIVARYTPTLPPVIYNRIGWTWSNDAGAELPTLLGWQYSGSGQRGEFMGDTSVTGYPTKTPIGIADTTAIIGAGGGDGGLELLKRVTGREGQRVGGS